MLAESGVGALRPTAWPISVVAPERHARARRPPRAGQHHPRDGPGWLPLRRNPSARRVSASPHTAAISRNDVAIRQRRWHSHGQLAALRRGPGDVHPRVRTADEAATPLLIVEYDSEAAGRWLPYPVSQARLTALFTDAGNSSITMLRSRPSVYRRAVLYAAVVTTSGPKERLSRVRHVRRADRRQRCWTPSGYDVLRTGPIRFCNALSSIHHGIGEEIVISTISRMQRVEYSEQAQHRLPRDAHTQPTFDLAFDLVDNRPLRSSSLLRQGAAPVRPRPGMNVTCTRRRGLHPARRRTRAAHREGRSCWPRRRSLRP